jgi:acetylglutamate kinase
MKETLHIYKIGGKIIDQESRLSVFLKQFASVKGHKILVHGGGCTADHVLERMHIKPVYEKGRRITDKDTLDVVMMTYSGLINTKIVALLQHYDCNAIGMTGADGNTILAEKRPPGEVDFGYAGDVIDTDPETVRHLLAGNLVPVFCALTHNKKGCILNTNADTITSALAAGLSEMFSVNVVYCLEKPGVLKDVKDTNAFYTKLTQENYRRGVAEGRFSDGILPKLSNAFNALEKGASAVWITAYDKINLAEHVGTQIVL